MDKTEHESEQDFFPHHEHDNDDEKDLSHKREVRRMLEEQLERKRLKDELEDFDGELEDDFDWDNLD